MPTLGIFLSSEERSAPELVDLAARGEQAGFAKAWISDHFHPWTNEQGQSPFVWTVLGGIACQTSDLEVTTAVTCPTVRTHPAIVAQAAATTATLMPGRFGLGVGSGEALNEHIFGDRWPPADVRLEMLEEAIDVMRLLWQGGTQSHDGKHYRVENARIYTLPDEPPPVVVAAAGEKAAQVAARKGDGFMNTAPDADTIKAWEQAGGSGPKYGQIAVCWANDTDTAKKQAYELWPNAAVSGQLSQDLPTPTHFEQAVELVTADDVAQSVACGPDPGRHFEMIAKYRDAGYDHIAFHQIGPDQEGFFRFY